MRPSAYFRLSVELCPPAIPIAPFPWWPKLIPFFLTFLLTFSFSFFFVFFHLRFTLFFSITITVVARRTPFGYSVPPFYCRPVCGMGWVTLARARGTGCPLTRYQLRHAGYDPMYTHPSPVMKRDESFKFTNAGTKLHTISLFFLSRPTQ